MLTYSEALGQILQLPLAVRTERVPLLSAHGRILAASLTAPFPLPRYTNSSMDGFAVRAEDTRGATETSPRQLSIIGESAAGHSFEGIVAPGQCARISTGAALPDGADSVVPIERITESGDTITVRGEAKAGQFIRRRGEDVAEGAQLLGRGKRIDAAVLAFLAAYNISEVDVLAPPRVSILTSGDELKMLGEPITEHQIIAASLYYLKAELRTLGCEPRIFGIAPDEPRAFRVMLEQALEWGDCVVTTAGVSVGTHDVVGDVIRELRGEVLFWKVNVRPGKPMLVARFENKPLFGLPGNPVSTCCNTEIFVKPFFRKHLGIAPVETPQEKMTLVTDCPRDPQRQFFVYGRCAVRDGDWIVEALANQSSGNLSNPAHANCLIVVEPGDSGLKSGEAVSVVRIR